MIPKLPPIRQTLRIAGHFAFWQSAPPPELDASRKLVLVMGNLLFAAIALVELAFSFDKYISFDPAGATATIGIIAVTCIAVANRVEAEHRDRVMAVFLGLLIVASGLWLALASLSNLFCHFLIARLGENPAWKANLLIAGIILIWLIGATRLLLIWVEGEKHDRQAAMRRGLRVLVIASAPILSFYCFPGPWIYDFYDRSLLGNSVWWYLDQPAAPAANAPPDRHEILRKQLATAELRQAPLLQSELDHLAPRDPDKTNIFALGIAGDMMTDVFPREVNHGLEIFGKRFGFENHTVKLINHLDFIDQLPVASRQNFVSAVNGIARHMDTDKDLFVLYMTSHGSKSGLYLDMGNLAWGALSPATVKETLDAAGIHNRLIIVSACHSGVFVGPLSGPNTAVVTASSADHLSFGCSNQPEWTYFGDALFHDGLSEHSNLPEAFYAARSAVTMRELLVNVTPSDPQISIGSDLPAKFPDLFPADKIRQPDIALVKAADAK